MINQLEMAESPVAFHLRDALRSTRKSAVIFYAMANRQQKATGESFDHVAVTSTPAAACDNEISKFKTNAYW